MTPDRVQTTQTIVERALVDVFKRYGTHEAITTEDLAAQVWERLVILDGVLFRAPDLLKAAGAGETPRP